MTINGDQHMKKRIYTVKIKNSKGVEDTCRVLATDPKNAVDTIKAVGGISPKCKVTGVWSGV